MCVQHRARLKVTESLSVTALRRLIDKYVSLQIIILHVVENELGIVLYQLDFVNFSHQQLSCVTVTHIQSIRVLSLSASPRPLLLLIYFLLDHIKKQSTTTNVTVLLTKLYSIQKG